MRSDVHEGQTPRKEGLSSNTHLCAHKQMPHLRQSLVMLIMLVMRAMLVCCATANAVGVGDADDADAAADTGDEAD